MRGGLQWPNWGMFVEIQGQAGREVRHGSRPASCSTTSRNGRHATDSAVRRKAWDEILQTNADEVFSIGTVNGIRQPIVVGPKVRNVPKEGYYAWDPGGYIGLYQPEHVLDRAVGGHCHRARRGTFSDADQRVLAALGMTPFSAARAVR